MSNELIVFQKDEWALNAAIQSQKNLALIQASTVEQVTTQEEKEVANSVQRTISAILSDVEKCRKSVKEPFLDTCREIDGAAKAFSLQLENAQTHIAGLISDFNSAEIERLRAIELARAAELDRIDRDRRDAEMKAAREQAALEAARLNKIREDARAAQEKARQEAAKAEAEAKAIRDAEALKLSAAEAERKRIEWEAGAEDRRIAAEKAQAEIEARNKVAEAAEIERSDRELRERMDRQAELAKQQVEALGPEQTLKRAKGERISMAWHIDSIDVWQLVKARPDLCDVTPKMRELKEALNQGEVKGVLARKVPSSTATAGKTIEV